MRILINASNLTKGGGVQVADSIVHELKHHLEHHFIVVASLQVAATCADIADLPHIKLVVYNLPSSALTALTGRDKTLDSLVKEYHVDVVLTIFGPSRWRPRVPHLCGYARSQLCIPESPFWKEIKGLQRFKSNARKLLNKWLFKLSADDLWTENSFISRRVKGLYPAKRVYTVTNNYNQIFDKPSAWDRSLNLPAFDGTTLLTVSANYPHKNLKIIRPCIAYLREHHPELHFRFILTLNEQDFFPLTAEERRHIQLIGSVKITQVPHLYEQADIMFLPSLLECFSANYAEAMRMGVPILTTDLGFAHSLCHEAADYFSPIDAADLGEHIYRLSADSSLRAQLAKEGKRQLEFFDTAAERCTKLIEILENLYRQNT